MAEDLSQERIAQLHDVFALLDTNNDGFINITEMRDLLVSIGKSPSEEDAKKAFDKFDLDHSGRKTIDFAEFLNVIGKDKSLWDPLNDPEMLQLFKFFDRDNDGYVTHEEVQRAMEQAGEKMTNSEVHEMITEADTDGDGRLTYAEFKAVMNKYHGKE